MSGTVGYLGSRGNAYPLADALLELFPDIHVRRVWISPDGGWIQPAEIVPAGATHVRFDLCTISTPITKEPR